MPVTREASSIRRKEITSWVLALLLTVGCAKPKTTRATLQYDSGVAGEMVAVLDLLGEDLATAVRSRRVSVVLVDSLPDAEGGFCHPDAGGNRIDVSKEVYLTLTDLERKAILIHELGHCTFGLEHDDATQRRTSGDQSHTLPVSLMSSGAVPAWALELFFDEYVEEFRTRARQTL